MEGFMSAIGGRRANDETGRAQEVMYEAWDQTNPRARVALAHKALTISPLCADAYVLLAEEEAKSVEEALEYYRKGVEAGVQVLGPKGFKEYAGHFWGFLETRPYMRARAGLAATLNALGEVDAAISNYRDMLRLNPNDNQGIRYELASCLMKSGDTEALKKLLKQYEAVGGAQFVPKDRMYGSGEVPFAGPNVAGYNILYTTTDVVLANIAVAKCVRSN
jgi:tetratricopeptide (TPR) repeat protein